MPQAIKKTDKKVFYAGRERSVYVGERGGLYMKKDGDYVPLPKVTKKTVHKGGNPPLSDTEKAYIKTQIKESLRYNGYRRPDKVELQRVLSMDVKKAYTEEQFVNVIYDRLVAGGLEYREHQTFGYTEIKELAILLAQEKNGDNVQENIKIEIGKIVTNFNKGVPRPTLARIQTQAAIAANRKVEAEQRRLAEEAKKRKREGEAKYSDLAIGIGEKFMNTTFRPTGNIKLDNPKTDKKYIEDAIDTAIEQDGLEVSKIIEALNTHLSELTADAESERVHVALQYLASKQRERSRS